MAMAVCAALLLVLPACGEPAGVTTPLPLLRAPGLAPLAGLASLRDGDPADFIGGLAAYRRAPSSGAGGEARVLASTSSAVYDLSLDGGDPRRVTPSAPCGASSTLSATPEGRWAACAAHDGIAAFAPRADQEGQGGIVLLNAFATGQGTPTAARGIYLYPAWAPDGAHLAAVTTVGGGCSIVIATPDVPSATFRITARLALFAADPPPARSRILPGRPMAPGSPSPGPRLSAGGRSTSTPCASHPSRPPRSATRMAR